MGTVLFTEHKYNRFVLFQKMFVNDGILKPIHRREMIDDFVQWELGQSEKCLQQLISMSRNEIDHPEFVRFAPSWHKHFNSTLQ